MAKKYTLVNINAYSDPTSPGIEDKFRFNFGSWTSTVETKNIYFEKNTRSPYKLHEYQISAKEFYEINKIFESNSPISKDQNFTPSNHMIIVPTTAHGSVPYLENVHRLSFYKAERTNKGNLFANINYGVRYENIVSSFSLPNNPTDNSDYQLSRKQGFNNSQIVGNNLSITDNEVDVEFIYHTENIRYETESANVDLEYALPNFYEVTNYLKTFEDKTAEDFIISTIGEYQTSNSKRSRFKNIIVTPEAYKTDIEYGNSLYGLIREVDFLNTHRLIKGSYQKEKSIEGIPNYVKITIKKDSYDFDSTSGARISNLNVLSSLQKNNKMILDNFMFFKKDIAGINDFDIGSLLMRWHIEYENVLSNLPRSNRKYVTSRESETGNTNYQINTERLYSYDFFRWLLEQAPSLITQLPKDMTIFGNNTDSGDLAIINKDKLFEIKFVVSKIIESFCHGMPAGTINLESIADRYVSLYNKLYTFKEMLRCGGLGESEILFYKIEKFNGTNTTSDPLQTFVIPNVFDGSTEYLDTQVKYGTEYTYKISEVRAILGTEYEYVKLNQPKEVATKNSIVFGVRQFPRIKIVELPIYEKTGQILGEPPLTPQFQLFPVRRKKNKLKLFFEPTYGKEKMYPISLTRLDATQNTQKINQTFGSFGQIYYSNKSSVNRYEVYYTETTPTVTNADKDSVYANFFDSLYASVETDSDLVSPINADSATMQLNLTPNKKYYVTFIARNRLGLASNPTNIYELEMVNDSGYSYPVIKPLEFNQSILPETKKYSKSLTKIISIQASTIQSAINESYLLDENNRPKNLKGTSIKPGPLGPSGIFPESEPRNTESQAIRDGKTFKLRFTSKNSGKSFDINLTFKHNRIQSPFEIGPTDQIVRPIPLDRASIGTSGVKDSIPQGIGPLTPQANYSCRYDNDNPFTGYYYPEVGTSPSMIKIEVKPPIKDPGTGVSTPVGVIPPNIMSTIPPNSGDGYL